MQPKILITLCVLNIFFSFSIGKGPETKFFSLHQTKWFGASEFSYPELVAGVEILFEDKFRYADKNLAKKIVDISLERRLDPLWIAALIWTESSFNPRALSPKGAFGLMQLMPSTAAEIQNELSIKDEFHWKKADGNLQLGSFYLKKLLKGFKGNHKLASMAYNLGRVGLLRRIRRSGVPKMKYWNRIESRYHYLVLKLQSSKHLAKADSVKFL